jgi:predicted NAD-dependent protein-ADP-ribosyltransferase YbiA (DUF1768 family)
MAYFNQTYRIVDGERIEGSWRHIFIKNGNTYFLTDLEVYADGMVDCWGVIDFATFQQKVKSGWVATTFAQGARASVHHLVTWQFDQAMSWLAPQDLITEVGNEIERLAGRPALEDRLHAALDRYLDDPTDENLVTLREAYFAVPEHLRIYLLGDMDAKDIPLRKLIMPVGETYQGLYSTDGEQVVQQSDYDAAWAYFRRRQDEKRQAQNAPPPWEDDPIARDPTIIRFDKHDGGHPYLANDYPAAVTLEEGVFPTITHAYWALATTDLDARNRIVSASTAHEAQRIAQGASLRPDWNVVRLAVMLRLVREKFRQHPDLAAQLIATGDGRLINGVDFSKYWGDYRGHGRNWLVLCYS